MIVAVVAVLCLIAPLAADAQQRPPRVGIMVPVSVAGLSPFKQELHALGWVEGSTVTLEIRSAEGKPERFPSFAADLVSLKVDVILAIGDPAIAAAKKATTSIPIVMAGAVDPVSSGFVANLARPDGNITGLTDLSVDLTSKRLQLLKEATPALSRLAVIWDPSDRSGRQTLGAVEAAARALRLKLLKPVEVRSPADFEPAFAAATRSRANAVYVLGSIMNFSHRARIAELGMKYRLPTVCGVLLAYVEAGCLVGYGPSIDDRSRRAAHFVDKILKGARPADLPVEQPTKFSFVLNLKTARAIGLSIPTGLRLQADRVVEYDDDRSVPTHCSRLRDPLCNRRNSG